MQVSAQGQGHRALTRGVQELAKAIGQLQPGQIGQALQIQVQAKLVGIRQLEVQVEHELAARVVDAQIQQIGRQVQRRLEGALGRFEPVDRLVHDVLQLAQPGVAQHHQLRQRTVDHRQLRSVESLVGRQIVDDLQTKAHRINDVAKVDVAHIQQAAQIGQHDHHRASRERAVGNRLLQVEGRVTYFYIAPVEQVGHVKSQLQVLVQRHAGTASAHTQTLEAGRRTARHVHRDAAQRLAREQLGQGKAGAAGLVGRAIERQRGQRLQLHA